MTAQEARASRLKVLESVASALGTTLDGLPPFDAVSYPLRVRLPLGHNTEIFIWQGDDIMLKVERVSEAQLKAILAALKGTTDGRTQEYPLLSEGTGLP